MTNERTNLDIGTLYRQYGAVVMRRIRRFFGPEQAEDVLQEVFLRAHQKLHTFRGDSSPVTWLYQLTTRYCINRIRDEGRRKELWIEQSPGVFWSQPTTSASQEQRALLKELWKHLDEEIVMIGVYYYGDGLTQAEIAKLVGCSRRTVGNRIVQLQQEARKLGGGE